jgi:cyclopropane-fatty-acyl-phospholipid synthase
VLNLLARLPQGRLDLQLPDGQVQRLPGGRRQRPARGSMVLHNWAVFERTLKAGDIGLAESYIDGDWDSPDLAALLRLCIRNREHIEGLIYGRWWGALAYRLRHLLRRNTRSGSAKNIHAHYDLGNSFYRLWLDPTMSYSAAWFEGRDPRGVDLQAAQQAKCAAPCARPG